MTRGVMTETPAWVHSVTVGAPSQSGGGLLGSE